MAYILFHRASGTAFVYDGQDAERIEAKLGPEVVAQCERLTTGGGTIRIDALGQATLSVTTLFDRALMNG